MFENYQKLILAYADFYSSANFFKDFNHHDKNFYNYSILDQNRLSIVDDPRGYFDNHVYLKETLPTEPTCQIEDNTIIKDYSFNKLEIFDIINILVVLVNLIFAKRYLTNHLKNSVSCFTLMLSFMI